MKTVFTLSSGRSETRFLCHLFRRNLSDAVCRHEPYFEWSNLTMFGRPIYDHGWGNLDEIRGLLRRPRTNAGVARTGKPSGQYRFP